MPISRVTSGVPAPLFVFLVLKYPEEYKIWSACKGVISCVFGWMDVSNVAVTCSGA